MEDVNISKYRAQVVRTGSTPASPGFVVSEGQDPVNPSGSSIYVPYSGAISNVDFGEFGLDTGFVTLDTTPTNIPTEQGTIFWDADDETVDIVLNGYTMKIGEDLFYPVKNQTGSTIAKGVAVRFNGTVGNSGRLLIAPFIANGSVPSSRFMGVTAEEILNGEDGKVLYFGRVRGINTNSFNEGDILYASTTSAGGYQTAIPVAPNNIVQVAAVVTKSATVGTIFVRPTLGSNINKDEGVKITSVADKNLLQYQSGTSLWENKSLAQILGGTSSQFVKGDGSLDSNTYGTGTVTSVGLSSATSGVTIGSTPITTSGTITLAIATASGSQNGLLSSTDWTTFNGKQNALTNPVTGTGTSGQIAYFTGTSAISSESNLFWDATNDRLGIGTNLPSVKLNIVETDETTAIQVNDASTAQKLMITNTSITIGRSSGSNANFKIGTINQTWGANGGNLLLQTNGSENIRIWNSTGNVNIGPAPTSDAGFKLDVNGTGRFSGNLEVVKSSNPYLIINDSGVASTGGILFQPTGFNAKGGLTLNFATAEQRLFTGEGGNTYFQTFYTNGVERLRIASTGAATFSSSVTADGLFRSNQGVLQIFAAGGFRGGVYNYASWLGSGTDYSPTLASETNIYFATAGSITRQMTITSGGNVLIGTTTDAGDKLQVNGAIKTSAPSGGTAGSWKFGTATSGIFTIGGKIRIEINGVAYDILTT